MAELSLDEIDAVSGAGAITLGIGNALYGATYATNTVLNTPLISSVGQVFNKFPPVGTAIHFAADTAGFLAFQTAEAAAKAIGGSQVGANLGPIPYHYYTEWA